MDKDILKNVNTIFDVTQLNYKIIANSFYGVTGTSASRFYLPQVAMSITMMGQVMIQKCKEAMIKNGFDILYSDSVSGDTKIIIRTNNKVKEIPISNLFNRVDAEHFGKEYQLINNIEVLTIDYDGCVCFKPINYIMRHRCEKQMYRVWISNETFVDVTEDHSLIGYLSTSDNIWDNLIEVTPNDIINKKVENLVYLNKWDNDHWGIKNSNFVLSSPLNVEKISYDGYVYDIEVDGIHMFFANRILVHNTDSTFIDLDRYIPDEIRGDEAKIKDYLYKKIIPKMYDIINPELEELARKWGIRDNRLEMKQEVIGSKIVFFYKRAKSKKEKENPQSAKKRYIARIIDKEGVSCDELMIRGLEVRRSELSKVIKDRITEIYSYILNTNDTWDQIREEIINKSKELKSYILSRIDVMDLDVIGININIKSLEDYKSNTPQYRGLLLWNIFGDLYDMPKTTSVIKGRMLYINLKENSELDKYLSDNDIEFYNPAKKVNEKLDKATVTALVIPPQFKDKIDKRIWSDIELDVNTQMKRIFYGPLTSLFDLFKIDVKEVEI